jgi:hypothetical protein
VFHQPTPGERVLRACASEKGRAFRAQAAGQWQDPTTGWSLEAR